MRAALKRFGAWYWFHFKRALWNWHSKPRTFKEHMLEVWSFFIVIWVKNLVIITFFILVVCVLLVLQWLGFA